MSKGMGWRSIRLCIEGLLRCYQDMEFVENNAFANNLEDCLAAR